MTKLTGRNNVTPHKMKWVLTVLTIAWFVLMLGLSRESGEASGIVTHQVAQQIGDASPKAEQLGYWDQVKRVDRIHDAIRSAGHVAVFFVLAVLLTLTAEAWGVHLGFAAAFLAAWSGLDEVLKLWSRGRHCDVEDIGFNLAGALLGFLAGQLLLALHRKRKDLKKQLVEVLARHILG